MGRWDHILDQKPQDIREYVLDKVAEQLAEDLRNFPPPIDEWLDGKQTQESQTVTLPDVWDYNSFLVELRACERVLARPDNRAA